MTSLRDRKAPSSSKSCKGENGDHDDETKKKFTLNDLDTKVTIGTGTFGRVFVAEDVRDGQVYAMKVMKIHDIIKLNQVQHVNDERKVLLMVSHPFIVKCLWTCIDEICLYMLLEFVPGGELFTYLRNAGRFSPSVALFYVAEIVCVFDYMHKNEIVYRDLKPENLLLDRDGHLRFTDFGFSKVLRNDTYTLCGTPEYLSPEAIQGRGHDLTCDWWALGILTYEMTVGCPPFTDDNPFCIYEKILCCQLTFPKFMEGTAQRDFIRRLVVADRSKRMGKGETGTEDVKQHKWLRDMNWSDVYYKRLKPPIKPKIAYAGDTSNFDDFDEDWGLESCTHASNAEHELFSTWPGAVT